MKLDFDFDYITLGLGLTRVDDTRAINPADIESIKRADSGVWVIKLRSASELYFEDSEMSELEKIIKAREERLRQMRKAAIDDEAKSQIEAQAKALAEMSGVVAPGGVVVNAQPHKRFRQ